MSCSEHEALLSAHLDGELDARATARIEAHLAGCASCAARARELAELSRAVREQASRPEPSDALRRRLAASLRTERAPRAPLRAVSIATHALAAAAAGMLAWIAASSWVRPTQEQRIGEDVISAHVRSLLADHLTDVTSSDRHTVNPWFQGKLDFAPGARDHAERGYALEGGRLDYVAGTVVASIVYRHGPHAMNLFVWPSEASSDGPPERYAARGFHAVHWESGGLEHWLVSDADEKTLQELAGLLRSEP